MSYRTYLDILMHLGDRAPVSRPGVKPGRPLITPMYSLPRAEVVGVLTRQYARLDRWSEAGD
jgi:hypothetical protein